MSEEGKVRALLDEAEAIDECASLISSMSEQISSVAKNVHIMGECADATVELLGKWTSECFKCALMSSAHMRAFIAANAFPLRVFPAA